MLPVTSGKRTTLPSNQATRCACQHALLLHGDNGTRCKVNRCKCLCFALPASTLADRVKPSSLDALLSVKHSIQVDAMRKRPIIGLRGEHHTFRTALGECGDRMIIADFPEVSDDATS